MVDICLIIAAKSVLESLEWLTFGIFRLICLFFKTLFPLHHLMELPANCNCTLSKFENYPFYFAKNCHENAASVSHVFSAVLRGNMTGKPSWFLAAIGCLFSFCFLKIPTSKFFFC